MQIQNIFNKAVEFHKEGNAAGAEKIYRDILQRAPDHPDALHMLGLLYSQHKQFERAQECLQRAVEVYPDSEVYLTSLGQLFASMGDAERAIECFNKAIIIDRKFPKPYFALAKIYRDNEDYLMAEEFFRKTVERKPNHYAAWNNLGNMLQKAEKTDEALDCFRRVIEIKPDIAEVHNNIAGIWKIKGDNDKAEEGYKEAIRLNPRFDKAHMNLGNIYMGQKRLDLAEECLRKAVDLNRENHEALTSLASLMQSQGRVEETIPIIRAAIKLKPEIAGPYIALGSSYQTRGDLGNAEKCYLKAIELESDSALALMHYGVLQESSNRMPEALETFGRTLDLEPDFSTKVFLYIFQLELKLGLWDEYDKRLAELTKRLETYVTGDDQDFDLPTLSLNYFPLPNELHYQVAIKIAGKIEESMADIKKRCNFSYEMNSAGKLNIGYVSPDFRMHAVGILINEMFRFHDRDKFEVFAYSLVGVDDEVSANIKTIVDSFVDISKVSPETAARRINDDKIDILIDLAGYTTYSCPSIFALQPAPVQALYLGYPSTTGADYIQYLLADAQIIDKDLEPFYSEKIVYLPSAFLSSPMEISKKPKEREEYGIPADAFVFCCFNTSYKIEPNTFAVWMEIMNEVPESLLWISKVDDAHCERIRGEAEKRGISGKRILFAEREEMPDFLARMAHADLFLDTFIYSAGSTAVCSLYAGLPLLTLAGPTNSSRMGSSICTASGHAELVCKSKEEYKARAIYYANNPEELKSISNRLLEEREDLPIFDTAAFVQNLENGYMQIWERHLDGKPTENITL